MQERGEAYCGFNRKERGNSRGAPTHKSLQVSTCSNAFVKCICKIHYPMKEAVITVCINL